jgi:hypothetical protein
MFGKGALIYVAGFAIVFGIYQAKLGSLAVSASDNFNEYYIETLVHESAASAMNYAVNDVWANNTTSASYQVIAAPCTTQVTVSTLSAETVQVEVVTHTYFFEDEYWVSHNTQKPIQDSIRALFAGEKGISQYFWYTNTNIGQEFADGDSVYGPIHTNSTFRWKQNPVFMGKVTATKFAGNPANDSDVFLGGYEAGVSIPMPTDMSDVKNLAMTGNGGHPGSGGDAWNTSSMYNDVVWLEFQSNGDVIRYVGSTKATAVVDTVEVEDIAPDGALWSTEDIHVEGSVNGKLTLYSEGDVIIEDDLVYADNPLSNPSSDDMIGLIAEDEVFIDYSGPPKDEYLLQCSAYAIGGSFRIEKLDHNSSDFTFRVLGSLAMAVGKQAGEGAISSVSFDKIFYHDPRLAGDAPPAFPGVDNLHLIAWWE